MGRYLFFKVHLVSNRRRPHQVEAKDSSGTICCCVRSNVWRKCRNLKRDKKKHSWLTCHDESGTFREYGDLDPWYQSLDLQSGANTYILLKGRQVIWPIIPAPTTATDPAEATIPATIFNCRLFIGPSRFGGHQNIWFVRWSKKTTSWIFFV